jgi:hypothetical protein
MAPEVEHKLAAILSAGAVGYSRLMAEDEAAMIHTLSSYREQITAAAWWTRPGDNVLAEFPTALEGRLSRPRPGGSAPRAGIRIRMDLASLPDEVKELVRAQLEVRQLRVTCNRPGDLRLERP